MKINFITYKYLNIPNYLNISLKMPPMSDLEKEIKDEEPYGLGCALEGFQEKDEIHKLIDNIKNLENAELNVCEKAYERFVFIMSLYHEQPHLLDPYIEGMLNKFITSIRDSNNSIKLKHMTFKYMYILVNVRGYKLIVSRLPHEVSDFEPVLQLLESQDSNDCENWTTRYILLLWLSIIVMIPFHMSRLDGIIDEKNENNTVMLRVLNIIKIYSQVPDKCRDVTSYLAARFLTRYDVKIEQLSKFLDWAKELSLTDSRNVFAKYGTMSCVAMILKHGKREDLLPYARDLLKWIIVPSFKINTGSHVNKLVVKIVQRIGLTFLPPQVASWRYKRGNRSLLANLSSGDTKTKSNEELAQLNDDFDVPEEIEEVIDQLIQGLRNTDSIVRWSAAKGIGRVTGRLPKELADEVVASVLQLFSPREGDGAWHGSCLALAELGRRGLLLPQRLTEVVPLIVKALTYDELRGYASVGSHIRDAACYVCWSFARAYEVNDLKPYVNEIASTLVIVTCFDREINCRRAASAAFQENVGRQGTFPHGIDILTCADFFAVSVRNQSYLNIAPYIAKFNEYTIPLIDHLIDRKVDHWDCNIRELTAKSLHNLTSADPFYMSRVILKKLFEMIETINLNSRHGAVLAIGEIVYALSLISKNNEENLEVYIDEDILNKLKDLIVKFEKKFYFKGLGGELMRQACCDFIEKCSLSKLPFHNQPIIELWLKLINECIPYNVINVRSLAIKALPVLLNEYFKNDEEISKKLIDEYLNELKSVKIEVNRMGYALALGSLPKFMLKIDLELIVQSLIESTVITQQTLKWAEGRRDCVKALSNIIVTLQDDIVELLSEKLIDNLFYTFLEGLKDYTQDKRGDIGAWMREASMLAIQTLIFLLADKNILKKEIIVKCLSNISQQAVEKIDRTRALGGKVFYSFIYPDKHELESLIPHREDMMIIFPNEECNNLNWNSANCTFSKFVQLIKYPEFTYNILIGLICSIGGLTETLVKYSSSSLFTYLKVEKKHKGLDEIKRICDVIYQIFYDNQRNDRITIPMFKFLDKLFESGCIDCIINDINLDFSSKILKLIQFEISGCKDIYKLMDGADALCQFIQIKSEVCKVVLLQLSIMLCHRQVYVRRSTATKLYESLLIHGEESIINQDNLEEILQLLCNTNWEDSIDVIKPIRNELCKLMGVRVPSPKVKPNQNAN